MYNASQELHKKAAVNVQTNQQGGFAGPLRDLSGALYHQIQEAHQTYVRAVLINIDSKSEWLKSTLRPVGLSKYVYIYTYTYINILQTCGMLQCDEADFLSSWLPESTPSEDMCREFSHQVGNAFFSIPDATTVDSSIPVTVVSIVQDLSNWGQVLDQ